MQAIELTKEPTTEQIAQIREAIIEVLGEPDTLEREQAHELYSRGDYQGIKRMSAIYLGDSYIKCLGYLIGTFKPSPAMYTLIAESARAAVDRAAERAFDTKIIEDGNIDNRVMADRAATIERESKLLYLGAVVNKVTEA